MNEREVRAAALEAASRVYEGRASNAYNVIAAAQRFEEYILTGNTE